ncbi:hypothetical protein OTU49_011215 [Cherax quadricarinatus]|uniref:Homeobox domain-containing protein n=1 Tax=Cherax quadricarinatus TaxID=27406 RepID=A0AAW0W3K4_CHEQU
MVTRYTIDQILSYAHKRSTSPYSTTQSPPTTSSSTFTPGSSAASSPVVELDSQSRVTNNTDTYKDSTYASVRLVTDGKTTEDDSKEKEDKNVSSNIDRENDFPVLARPVALRPDTGLHERFSMETVARDFNTSLRPDLLYGGAGCDMMNGLGAGGGFYSLMLQKYMEAHYRSLATSRTYLPLSYSVLDSGVGYPVGRSRRRGGQVRFTASQTRELESYFRRHKYITPSQRKDIARELNLQERQVKTWFQNRRAKWRKMQAQSSDAARLETSPSPSTSQDDSEDDMDDENQVKTTNDKHQVVKSPKGDHNTHLSDKADGKSAVRRESGTTPTHNTK